MKILLDHNLDRRLARYLNTGNVSTTQEHGWADLLNGELLDAAEQELIDILLTADSNLKHQQNLEGRRIAVIVLRAPNNRLATHTEMIEQVEAVLRKIRPGELIEVFK